MDTAEPLRVKLLDKEHPVTLPDFTSREELFQAYLESGKKRGTAIFRVYGAAIGLTTRIGREGHADVSFEECGYNVLTYGGKVYAYLRNAGASIEDVSAAGKPIFAAIQANLFPRASEVEEQRGN